MNNLRGNGISRMSFLFTKFHVVSCDTVTVCVCYEYRVSQLQVNFNWSQLRLFLKHKIT